MLNMINGIRWIAYVLYICRLTTIQLQQ